MLNQFSLIQSLLFSLYFRSIRHELVTAPFRRPTESFSGQPKNLPVDFDVLEYGKILGVTAYHPDILPNDDSKYNNVPTWAYQQASLQLKKYDANQEILHDLPLLQIGANSLQADKFIHPMGGIVADPSASRVRYNPIIDFADLAKGNTTALNGNSIGENFIMSMYFTTSNYYERIKEYLQTNGNAIQALLFEHVKSVNIYIKFRGAGQDIHINGSNALHFQNDRFLRNQYCFAIKAYDPRVYPYLPNQQRNVSEDVFKRSFLTLTKNNQQFIKNLPLVSMSENSTQANNNMLLLGGSQIDIGQSYVFNKVSADFTNANADNFSDEYFGFTYYYVNSDALKTLYSLAGIGH